MTRISTKNQVTIPVRVLHEAGLQGGDRVVIETLTDGEVRLRRKTNNSFAGAFGALTGFYPHGYLHKIDREDEQR